MKKLLSLILLLTTSFCLSSPKEKFFAYRSFYPETSAMRAFGNAGINLYAVMPSNSFNTLGEPYCKFKPFWVWDETYLWNVVDEQFDLVIRQNQNAKFIVMIDINSPLWLYRRLEIRFGMGGDSFNDMTNSLCIPEWKNLTTKMVKAYVEHMEKRYGDRIFGYMIAGGGSSEWYDSSKGRALAFKEKEWEKYLQKKGLPNWVTPTHKELYTPTLDNLYFDPQTQAYRIHYAHFTEKLISDGMDYFSKVVRDIVGDKRQIGAFCGFLPHTLVGKIDNRQTYSSPYNDFVGDPGGYDNRRIGMGGGMNAPVKSLKLQGKHWFQEIDHRTHTFNYDLSAYIKIFGKDMYGMKNQQETNAMLKREFSLAIVMQNSLWCFDMWGGVFSTPETMEVVAKAHKLWQQHKDDNLPMHSEIVYIADPDSCMYIEYPSVRYFKRILFSCGASFDHIIFDDIAKVDFSKYKVVVFPHTFEITPEKKKLLDKYVFKDNKTIVTMGAFGTTDGKRIDKKFTENLTGFKYKQNGINRKNMGDWVSVYAGDEESFNKNNFMDIIKKAGVHLYTDEPLPVYANENLVAIHTENGGKKTIYLPKKVKKVKELFTDKIIEVNDNKFEYNFSQPDTALFSLK